LADTTDAVLITYLDGRALYINQSFGRFLGFTNLTKSSIDIYSLHGKKLLDHILGCASQGFPCDQEVYLTNLNGVECPFQLRCSPIADDSFEPQGVCWIYTNISEQKK
jgi:PAS domain-containing protein